MSEIIEYLNNRGIKTSQGHEFNKCSIRTILLNKKYIGIYTFKGVEIPNGVPRIIDDESFNKVQEIMNKNQKAPARAKAKTEYLLTTKLFCGTCKEMMVGISGTSYNGSIHNYYSCNGKRKKICDRKNVRKEYIEDIVVRQARNILTDKNIRKIAKEIMKLIEEGQETAILKTLERSLKQKEKEKYNLMSSLKLCEIDSVKKAIFNELETIELELNNIKNSIRIERANIVKLTESEIVFFLEQIRSGNINDIKYRKILISVLINKVYLYDDNLTLIFNISDKNSAVIKIPSIEEIESSFLDKSPQPDYINLVTSCKATYKVFFIKKCAVRCAVGF